MNFKKYFKSKFSLEQSTISQLKILYQSGRFSEFNSVLLGTPHSYWNGQIMETGALLKDLKDTITALYANNEDMLEFISTIRAVDKVTQKNAPLYSTEAAYFANIDKFDYFMNGQEAMHKLMKSYGVAVRDYQSGMRLSVKFPDYNVFSYRNAQDLANDLLEATGMEFGLSSKTNPPPNQDRGQ